MSAPHRREAAIPLALAAGSFALAFVQRPGLATADTKSNLHLDPGRFLADVASMWTATGQLGDVQAGQQAGYLFPMGPFFAVGHAAGIADWVLQRLWLGALLALAAWGVVRLLDALLPGRRGAAHLVAGAVTVLNPFVVTYANRTTVTLLAYAALPWLLLAVHRGLRDERGWRWPATAALIAAASGGGINGAVTAWMLLGPALLLLYETLFEGVSWRAARAFLLRAVPLGVLVSLWWLIPAYVQSSYGIDFLHFTEQPGTVWGTTSITESLRLMSFWLSYVGIGFAGHPIAYFADSHTLLFSVPVVLATLLLPALALSGFVWTRRWRYGPFFLILALVALLVMGAGFPDGTPLRHGLYFIYNRVAAVRFLRASYKAAPLLAIALACLAGAAVPEALRRVRATRHPTGWLAAGTVACAAVLALAAWPLVTGTAQDAQVSFKAVPAAWRTAASDLDRQLPANSRAMVLPGALFAFYRWGGTVDPILAALSRRPVAERTEVPYSDLRATDLLWTVDGLVHQQRLLPGQLSPLLGLIGVRAVVTGTDHDLARSDAPAPADAATELGAQPGFAHATRSYGPVQSFAPTGLAAPSRLPQVRRYDLSAARGLVRVEPVAAPIVVDGSAAALAGLAAFGELSGGRALLYSGDLTAAQLTGALSQGGELVISDSNRRRAFVPSSLDQNTGPTLPADQGVSADGLILDPFGRGADFETVASFAGASSVHAPASPGRVQFPEHAPYAALDGSRQTAWVADPTLGPDQRWLQADFQHPIDVPYVELLPYDDAGGSVEAVEIDGHRFAVRQGWNRLALNLRAVSNLRLTLTRVGPAAPGAKAGAGGIRELRIPGVHISQALRLPVDAAQTLSGRGLDAVSLSYLFERTTGANPFRRDEAHGPFSALNIHDAGDAEVTIDRKFELPASRRFAAQAWVTVLAQAPDDALDRLAGYTGSTRATSSSRFDGEPGSRASRALDGNPRTAWLADWNAASPAWIQWRTARPSTVTALTLGAPALPVRRPTVVRILWPRGSTPPLAVGARGKVVLPRAVRSRSFRVEILSTAAPAGATAAEQRAVGISEVGGLSAPTRVAVRPAGSLETRCGAVRVRVGHATLPLRVAGTVTAFEAGTPLRARSCGADLALHAGAQRLRSEAGVFAVDELLLRSPAPRPLAQIATAGGTVLNSGTPGRGSYDRVRIAVSRPSWLVLGEGYDRGWKAWCDGRSLGSPSPIDGYANGWRVAPGCSRVRFAFAPNRLAAVGYLASVLAGLVCLALIAAGLWRRRARGVRLEREIDDLPPRPEPEPVPHALGARGWAGLAITALAFGFTFGIAAGLASVLVLAFVWKRAIGARWLTLAAGLLLGVVVPLLYLLHPGSTQGGNHFAYAMEHITAHWVGVAAFGLLMCALWRTLAGSSPTTRQARSASPPAESPAA